MMHKFSLTVFVFLALVLATDPSVQGTVVIPKTLTQLSAEADLVVVGTVTENSAAFLKGKKIIYTHTQVRVEATLIGKHQKTLRISEPGGSVGDVHCGVASMPRYAIGERVLIFLKKDALGFWRTHGLRQGRFKIIHDQREDEMLIPARPGLNQVIQKEFPPNERSNSGAVGLEEFREKILDLRRQAQEKKKGK